MAFNEQTAPIEVRQAGNNTTTVTSSNIDRNTYGRAQTFTFILSMGTIAGGTTPTLAISIEHSDDGSTGWAAITAAAGFNEVFTNTTAAAFKQATVKRTKRFLRVVQTVTGTPTTMNYALIAIAGDPIEGNI